MVNQNRAYCLIDAGNFCQDAYIVANIERHAAWIVLRCGLLHCSFAEKKQNTNGPVGKFLHPKTVL